MTAPVDCLNCGGELGRAGKTRGLCGRCYRRIYKSGSLDVLFPKLDPPDPQPVGRPGWHAAGFLEVDLTWQRDALCAQVGDDLWFPEKGGSTAEAKSVCRGCPVRMECLDYALDTGQRFGIWGGASERERRRLQRLDDVVDLEGAA